MKPDTKHMLTWFGLVLGLPLSAYVLNAVFFRPPPRPSPVPPDAVPFVHYQGAEAVWWWASCRDLESRTYHCRLYDHTSALAVAGRFAAVPRDYDDDGAKRPGQCRQDPTKRRFLGYNHSGEIHAHLGCVLVPRDFVYFPSRRMKAAVSLANGQAELAREIPMTDDDLKAAVR